MCVSVTTNADLDFGSLTAVHVNVLQQWNWRGSIWLRWILRVMCEYLWWSFIREFFKPKSSFTLPFQVDYPFILIHWHYITWIMSDNVPWQQYSYCFNCFSHFGMLQPQTAMCLSRIYCDKSSKVPHHCERIKCLRFLSFFSFCLSKTDICI